ncbi:MAG: L,D-transpeptidase [Thermodesulfovibrionales bacterium]|nr:L,D-transpeptidase [Thermodesulfovibrionales bacterium]
MNISRCKSFSLFLASVVFAFINLPSTSLALEYSIIIKISEQKLYLMNGSEVSKTYTVSTSRYGIGSGIKSRKTPLGLHRIAEKIGEGAPLGAIFDGKRRYTGETSIIYIDDTKLSENYELTRIIWLEGMEHGINKGKGIDSYKRLIYIHGTAEEGLIGTPASIGCIRMKNSDVIELFNLVNIGMLVEIIE